MTDADLEAIYEALAEAIDRAAPEPPEQVLARACLMLARTLGEREAALKAIADA